MARSRWLTEAVRFQTLREALERLGVDDLKCRARLFESKPPKRKADLVAHLNRQLTGGGPPSCGSLGLRPTLSRSPSPIGIRGFVGPSGKPVAVSQFRSALHA